MIFQNKDTQVPSCKNHILGEFKFQQYYLRISNLQYYIELQRKLY